MFLKMFIHKHSASTEKLYIKTKYYKSHVDVTLCYVDVTLCYVDVTLCYVDVKHDRTYRLMDF